MSVRFEPLTADLWPAFEAFFSTQSETNNCWCMWWRVPSREIVARNRDALRAAFRARVQEGPPPGLVAFEDDEPVGWVQVTPRDDVPRFNRGPAVKPATDTPEGTWALSCFFVQRGYRRRGLMTAMARAACAHAASEGATAVEAAALDRRTDLTRSDGFVGIVPALERAGFRHVERRTASRVLMRWRPEREPPPPDDVPR